MLVLPLRLSRGSRPVGVAGATALTLLWPSCEGPIGVPAVGLWAFFPQSLRAVGARALLMLYHTDAARVRR